MAAIGFKTAKCKDCYKCVRICPVKAIRIKDEHALYVADECVLCGRCLEACPQAVSYTHLFWIVLHVWRGLTI